MDMEYMCGATEIDTRENGEHASETVMDLISSPVMTNTLANIVTATPTGSGSINGPTATHMQESFLME